MRKVVLENLTLTRYIEGKRGYRETLNCKWIVEQALGDKESKDRVLWRAMFAHVLNGTSHRKMLFVQMNFNIIAGPMKILYRLITKIILCLFSDVQVV